MSKPDQPDESNTSGPTSLDVSAADSQTSQTRLDVTFLATPSAHTVREEASLAQHSLIQLPSVLRDRYRILNHLHSQGAEAELLLVEPQNNEKDEYRVIKLYRRGIKPKEDVLAKVKDGCPDHLVRLYDYGQSDGHWYEVLEYIKHGSLRQLLRERPLPEAYLREALRELAAGIEHLHSYGIIHRDLKPENILVREQIPLDLVIIDFGISSLTEMSQRFTSTSRTIRYASPESMGGEISRASDYWSIGMILAEASLGRHPLADLSDERAVTSWLATRPVDLSGITDSRWQNLLRGLLQRDPKSRWGAEQIKRWLEGNSALVAPIERVSPSSIPIGGSLQRATAPYQIEGDECWTAEQLGIALARHWKRARQDLGRGLLREWCTKELSSVATKRLFFDIEESSANLDDKLLSAILYLCPDIPPSFNGINLATPAAIGRLLDGARSASEDSDAKIARSLIDDIVEGKLLEKFNIPVESSLRPVLERLDAYRRWRKDRVSLEHVLINTWFYRTKLQNKIKNHDAAQRAIALAIVIDIQQADRIWAQAKTFADATAWRFWFHGCLDWVAARNEYFDVLLIWELLPRAQEWYEKEAAIVWVEPLSTPPLAEGWRLMLGKDYKRACLNLELIKSILSQSDLDNKTEVLADALIEASRNNWIPYRKLKEDTERKQEEREERLRKEREVEEERLRKEREVEEERLRKEREVEEERLRKEREVDEERLRKEKAAEEFRTNLFLLLAGLLLFLAIGYGMQSFDWKQIAFGACVLAAIGAFIVRNADAAWFLGILIGATIFVFAFSAKYGVYGLLWLKDYLVQLSNQVEVVSTLQQNNYKGEADEKAKQPSISVETQAIQYEKEGRYAEALDLYKQLADKGSPAYQVKLGIMFESGQGVPRDSITAVYWFRKAAEQGLADAQYFLGSMCLEGRGLKRDDSQAFRWFHIAAEQGHTDAQFELGRMYAKGVGVTQDDEKAIHWLRKADAQGHVRASKILNDDYIITSQEQTSLPREQTPLPREQTPPPREQTPRSREQTPPQSMQTAPSEIALPVDQVIKQVGPKDPRERCAAKDNFISRSLCESRACEKPEYKDHPYCISFKQLERQQ